MQSYISNLSLPDRFLSPPRALVILGSTGSIGTSALKVIAAHPDAFSIIGLAGASNVELLAEQAARWRPPLLAVLTEQKRKQLQVLLPDGYTPEILIGPDGYAQMARSPEAQFVLSAQVGAAGLPATLAAVEAGKIIALANKESMVLAGPLIRSLCTGNEAVILPVDSEHNALFQGLCGHDTRAVRKLVLTASGGPFRGKDRAFLATVTREQALNHPNWSMGAKISIDSATLMNKGLEFIEAHYLFGMPPENIEVVIHPESIIHSLVEYRDGSLLGHLGIPDMQIPIAYCLGYPHRLALDLAPLDLISIGKLTFEAPNATVFPCLDLARQALEAGPSYPIVLNAANEEAVSLFLNKAIGFLDIPEVIVRALDDHSPTRTLDFETIANIDQSTRQSVNRRAS